MSEIIFLGVLALIVIGPKELPELARTLGRFLNELKRSTNVLGDELKQQTGFDKLSKLDYFDDRHQQQGHHKDPADAGATEADEDLYPLHKDENKNADPEQLELSEGNNDRGSSVGEAEEQTHSKDPKKS